MVLFAAIVLIAQFPPVQNYLARHVVRYLSSELGTNVYVEQVSLSFPYTLELTKFGIDDRHSNPILTAGSLQVRLQSLLKKEDVLRFSSIRLDDPVINVMKYEGQEDYNIDFLIKYLASSDTTATGTAPLLFSLTNLSVNNASLRIRDLNKFSSAARIEPDNLFVEHLSLDASRISYVNDTLSLRLNQLSVVEQSGLSVRKLAAELMVCPTGIELKNVIIQTEVSDLLFDVHASFTNYSAFASFADSVYFKINLMPSEFNTTDLSCIAPELKGMDNLINIEGKISGQLSSLNIDDLKFSYGSSTSFKGNISLQGLPVVDETFIHLKVKDFQTIASDITAFRLPAALDKRTIRIPDPLNQIRRLKAKAVFTGFFTDFVSYGTFTTDIGKIATDLSLKYDFMAERLQFKGTLATRNFDIGTMLNDRGNLGIVNVKANIEGVNTERSGFDMVFNAEVDSFDFRGNNYRQMQVRGELRDRKFDGQLSVSDELLHLGFQGLVDLNMDPPVFDFHALIQDAKLAEMNLVDRDKSATLNTKLTFNFSGLEPDNLKGKMVAENTSYKELGKQAYVREATLQADPTKGQKKVLTFRSDIADADIEGMFDYARLWPALQKLATHLVPALKSLDTSSVILPDQVFNTTLRLKNVSAVTDIFVPGIQFGAGTLVTAGFDSRAKTFKLTAKSPMMLAGEVRINNPEIQVEAFDKGLILSGQASTVNLQSQDPTDELSLRLDDVRLASSLSGDSLNYKIGWKDTRAQNNNKSFISGIFSLSTNPVIELGIRESSVWIDNRLWNFNTSNNILFWNRNITVNDLAFECSNQKIAVNGVISDNPEDKLGVALNHIDLSTFSSLLQYYGLDAGGTLNGSATIRNLYTSPTVVSGISVKSFSFNKELLGDLHGVVDWDAENEVFNVNAAITVSGEAEIATPFQLKGKYFPSGEENKLDFGITLTNFRIKLFEPYLVDIVSNLNGLASGTLKLQGDFEAPVLLGMLSLMRTEFKLDYTNVVYSFADNVSFAKDKIYASNIKLNDSYGNTGLCDIVVHHDHFINPRLDLKVKATNLAGLNTDASLNSLFYGNAFVTGNLSLSGPFDDLSMSLDLKSDPRTSITIPITYAVDIADNSFIAFINPGDTLLSAPPEISASSVFKMQMDFDITNDALIQLYLPYQLGNIRASGEGKMSLRYHSTGDFSMYGDYYPNQGTFLFTLQNIINRPFILENGGVIRWSGDPYNADIDISGLYKLKVNLNSLPGINEEYRNRRFPVDCVVKLRNNLMNPDILFSIRMPSVDENVQRQVFSSLDTTNQVLMSQQIISLLTIGNFNFSVEQGNIASTIGASSIDIISSQVSNWLSQLSQDLDIGVNYRPGDKVSREELELALSTQLFNDRVLIDGNFLVGNTSNRNASNVVGDVNIEFLLTSDGRLRVRAFNKYNDLDITRREAPYTQGVGLFYRREFNDLNDLLKRRPIAPVKGELNTSSSEPQAQDSP